MPEYHSRDELEAFPHVRGTAYGPNDELIVFVTAKRAESDLGDDEIVPKEVVIQGETYQTDVVAVGIPHLTSTTEVETTPADHRKRHRPIPGGVSIGNAGIGAGTMGSPLLYHDGDPVTLSNAHVAGEAAEQFQPAKMDGRGSPFGVLKEASDLNPDEVQTTDSALIAVNDEEDISNEILGIGPLVDFGTADYSHSYKKAGRTTGVTEGELLGVDANLMVSYGPKTIRFRGCDVFSRMSAPGDSGSLIGHDPENTSMNTQPGDGGSVMYTEDEDGGLVATDLLFAGSSSATIGVPIISGVFGEHGQLEIPEQEDDSGNGDGSDDSSDDSSGDGSNGGSGDDNGDQDHMPERNFEDYVEELLVDEYGEENVERQYYLQYSGRYVDLVAYDPENERTWALELENDKGSALNGSGQARFYSTSLKHEDPDRGSVIPVLCVPAGHIDYEERHIIELSGVTVREIEMPEDVSLEGV